MLKRLLIALCVLVTADVLLLERVVFHRMANSDGRKPYQHSGGGGRDRRISNTLVESRCGEFSMPSISMPRRVSIVSRRCCFWLRHADDPGDHRGHDRAAVAAGVVAAQTDRRLTVGGGWTWSWRSVTLESAGATGRNENHLARRQAFCVSASSTTPSSPPVDET